MPKGTIKIQLVDNNGGGFNDYVEVDEGITLSAFMRKHGIDSKKNLVRVNREEIAHSTKLCDGDRVTVTPTKIDGANN